MPKLPIVKPKQVIRALRDAGFYLHHQIGSHARLIHSIDPTRRVTVPVHNKDIPRGTLANIIRQAGMTIEDFVDHL